MPTTKIVRTAKLILVSTFLAGLLVACSVNVKKEKNGDDKQVDIATPVGDIHVSKDPDAADTGLPVYPGAQLKQKDSDHDDNGANVNISGFGYGLKVVALEYQSSDAPEKIVSFYKNQLKKYGAVLTCQSEGLDLDTDMKGSDNKSRELTCNDKHGSDIELKVGTKENQHIVAIQADGKGSKFSLVLVRTHGKQADI
jgi:hypothetical protein